MGIVTISAKDFGRVIRERIEDDTQKVEAVALETALFAEARAVQKTDELGLVDRGQFKLSWSHRRVPGGAEVGNTAPHAIALEDGRRPGRPGPPLAPIREWVERKLVPNGVVKPEEVEQAARNIRWHIHHHGTRPHKLLAGLKPEIARMYRREALRRLQE